MARQDVLREVERRFRETGGIEDETAWLRARLRADDLPEARLRFAARLGHPAARQLCDDLVIGGNTLGLFSGWFGGRSPARPTPERFDSWFHGGAVWVHAYHPGCRPVTISDEDYFRHVRDAFLRERP